MDDQSTSTRVAALARLLGETGAAHGRYEEADLAGRRDEQWPQWYARYLLGHGFYELLGTPVPADGAEVLATWLAGADRSHRAQAPGEPWEPYYARYFLAHPAPG